MSSKKLMVGIAVSVIFVMGAGYIIYMGRPVMKLAPPSNSAADQRVVPTTNDGQGTTRSGGGTAGTSGTYSMADIQTHNNQISCWSVIKGNVYDLTTWVARHPGGPGPILGLCGTDGTDAFTNQHGGQGRPASMLALLKIGTLN